MADHTLADAFWPISPLSPTGGQLVSDIGFPPERKRSGRDAPEVIGNGLNGDPPGQGVVTSGIQVGEDGQDAAIVVVRELQAQLDEDAGAVLADRLL